MQTPQVCRSKEGEYEKVLLNSLNLPWPEPKKSLSKEHLSLCKEATSSEKVRVDQPSEEPPWDPIVNSSLHVESKKDSLPSEGKLLFGDFRPRIRLSESCLKSWCLGEW
ncbi:unnamed protein product [Camellia sinensis]